MAQLLTCGECGKRGVRRSANELICRYCKHTHPADDISDGAPVNDTGSGPPLARQAPPRSAGGVPLLVGVLFLAVLAFAGYRIGTDHSAPQHRTVNQAPPASCSQQATTTLPDGTTYCAYTPYPDTGPYKPCVPHGKAARRRFRGVCQSNAGATTDDGG